MTFDFSIISFVAVWAFPAYVIYVIVKNKFFKGITIDPIFQNLEVHYSQKTDTPDTKKPAKPYYIVNKKTKQAYWVSDLIIPYVKSKKIQYDSHDGEKALKTSFKEAKYHINPVNPSPNELGLELMEDGSLVSKDSFQVSKGLYFYSSRYETPSIVNFVSQAKNSIHFFGQSLEKLARQHVGIIETAINRGVRVQFWILNPNSNLVDDWDKIMFDDTADAVNNSLRTLCQKKKEFDEIKKNQLKIGTYDFVPLNSMIALDAETEDAKLLVEFPFYKLDVDKRPSILVCKKDRKELFDKLWESYKLVFSQSKEYDCQ